MEFLRQGGSRGVGNPRFLNSLLVPTPHEPPSLKTSRSLKAKTRKQRRVAQQHLNLLRVRGQETRRVGARVLATMRHRLRMPNPENPKTLKTLKTLRNLKTLKALKTAQTLNAQNLEPLRAFEGVELGVSLGAGFKGPAWRLGAWASGALSCSKRV